MEPVIPGATDSELLTRLVRDFEAAEQATSDSRQHAERDRDYYDTKQLTAQEIETLKRRGQPPVQSNRIKAKIDFLLGLEEKQRSDPKAFPRTPADEQSADAATDAIRFVLDDNEFPDISSQVFEHLLIEGLGGADISAIPVGPAPAAGEPDKRPIKIAIDLIPWDRIFYDPHSRKRDFSDCRYRGQVVWMDEADARAKWPDATKIFDVTKASEFADSNTYADIPRCRWTDEKRNRVRIVEMWCRHGEKIVQYKFTKAGILETKESPYVDEEGNSEDALELMSAFVDRDGNRYGVVRAWIDTQDEINKRRSKALHLVNSRQVHAEKGAVDDVEKARKELAKPDGFIETNPGMEFEVLPNGDMAAAQFQLLQESKQEIDSIGVNAALSGTEGRVMSGRALIARQEGGMAELGPVFGRRRRFALRVYRKIWNRIRQYWTEEKWVRVTDDEKNPRHVGLNQKVTRLQAEIERTEQAAQGGDQQAAAMLQHLQQLSQMPPEQIAQTAPQMLEVVEVRNNVAELDVDIILAEVPDTVAIQAEQFEKLAGLAQSGVPIPPEALVEASGLRNKDKILEKMGAKEGGIPPQVAAQIKQAGDAIEQAQADIAKREEAAKAEEQRMKDAAHELEMRLEKVKHAEEVLALKQKIAELTLPNMIAQAMPAPPMQQ